MNHPVVSTTIVYIYHEKIWWKIPSYNHMRYGSDNTYKYPYILNSNKDKKLRKFN